MSDLSPDAMTHEEHEVAHLFTRSGGLVFELRVSQRAPISARHCEWLKERRYFPTLHLLLDAALGEK